METTYAQSLKARFDRADDLCKDALQTFGVNPLRFTDSGGQEYTAEPLYHREVIEGFIECDDSVLSGRIVLSWRAGHGQGHLAITREQALRIISEGEYSVRISLATTSLHIVAEPEKR